KAASASAIYGVRAAHGVVSIPTKSGKYDMKPEITYDGYSGVHRAQNVVKMANSEQVSTYVMETGSAPDQQFLQNARQTYGRSRIKPNIPAVNTDWYDEIMRYGFIQSHSFSAMGGGER